MARFFEAQRIPHAFIGGVALNTWGLPRATFDLDLTLSLPKEGASSLLKSLEDEDFVVDPVFGRGFRDRLAGMETMHVHLPVGGTLMAVDFFFADTPFLRSVLERRIPVDLGQGPIQVCTAADLILFKLLADRPKDRVDIRNVIGVQGLPEREYLERWAAELGVSSRLEQLLHPEE